MILNSMCHQSSMQEIDLLNPQLDPRITFTRASTKTYFGSDGLMHTAAVDEWPLEYDPITLKPIGRSVWEQRTNLFLRSQEFDSASWIKDEMAVVADAGLAPDGTMSADKLVPSATNTLSHRTYQDVTATATAYAATIFAKAAGYNYLRLTNFSASATINLTDGSVVASAGTPDAFRVTQAPSGFWRIEVAKTVVAGTIRTQLAVYNSAAQTSYAGDGVSGVYIWGAQFEAGTNASPYITTASSQVTRVSDLPRIEGVGTLRFNPAVGSLFVDFTVGGERGDAYPAHVVGFGDVADNSVFRASAVYDNRLSVGFLAPAANIPQYADMTGARVKVAQSYVGGAALTEKNAAIDGVARVAAWNGSGSLNTSTVGRLAIGWSGRAITRDRFMAGWVRSIRYYPSDLAPAELQALTA